MENRVKTENGQCSGCGLCVDICKKNAIAMKEAEDGFKYPVIDEALCVNCHACAKRCPFDKNKCGYLASNSTLESYLFKHKQDIRKESASGGFFTLLSDAILKKGGVVYGAVFDRTYRVIHVRTDNKLARNAIRGSKYVQSNISEDIYKAIIADVKSNKTVLFTGTPCQCAAVTELFHGEIPQNLIIMDLICHGVLSERLFQEYIADVKRRNKEHSNISKINLRDKEFGWQESSVTFADGYKHHGKQDYFYSIYSMNALQRDSCFECVYSQHKRVGDFTVGDFWGIKDSYPDLYDDLGVSLVLANTERAVSFMEEVETKPEIVMRKIRI